MIKNPKPSLLIAISILISLFVFVYFFFFHSTELVYVDSNKLLAGYKGMVEARKEYEKKRTTWQSNVDTLTTGVQDAIKKYEKDLALGSPKEKNRH